MLRQMPVAPRDDDDDDDGAELSCNSYRVIWAFYQAHPHGVHAAGTTAVPEQLSQLSESVRRL